jgi:ATP-binding protein involved in chromosome partitioning
MQIQTSEIKKLLEEVKLPAQKTSIVEAGLVSKLEVKEQSILLELNLPEKNPTFEKSLRYQAQKAIHTKYPKAAVVVEFKDNEKPQAQAPQIGTMIAIASGKGGVGKSSVTVNLAMALKKMKYKVGILDCDVYGPSIPTMMGVEGAKPLVIDQKIQPIEAHGIQLMSAGFFVEADQGLVWRGPMIHKLIQQFYMDVNWDGTDVLLIDLPPGTGDAPLSLAQTMPLTGAVMVTLPQKISLVDVRKSFAMFEHLKIPIFGLIENMKEFVCPKCEHVEAIFTKNGVEGFCREKSIAFLGGLPMDPKLSEGCDTGLPYLLENADRPAGKAFLEVAKKLQPMIKTADDLNDANFGLSL